MGRRLRTAGTGRSSYRGLPFMCILLGALTAAGNGCTRPFYRRQADKEVNEVLAEKDRYPNWAIEHSSMSRHTSAAVAFLDDCGVMYR